jgi:hypothetical protein
MSDSELRLTIVEPPLSPNSPEEPLESVVEENVDSVIREELDPEILEDIDTQLETRIYGDGDVGPYAGPYAVYDNDDYNLILQLQKYYLEQGYQSLYVRQNPPSKKHALFIHKLPSVVGTPSVSSSNIEPDTPESVTTPSARVRTPVVIRGLVLTECMYTYDYDGQIRYCQGTDVTKCRGCTKDFCYTHCEPPIKYFCPGCYAELDPEDKVEVMRDVASLYYNRVLHLEYYIRSIRIPVPLPFPSE